MKYTVNNGEDGINETVESRSLMYLQWVDKSYKNITGMLHTQQIINSLPHTWDYLATEKYKSI